MQKYFTIAEAANHLKYSEDQVFKVMQPGRPGATISPAFFVGSSLDAKNKNTGKRCRVSPGVYEIGVFPFTTWINGTKVTFRVLEWDKDGFAYVNELTSYEAYDQPVHISLALFPTEGGNRRQILAHAKPEIILGCEHLATREELEHASRPKSWMDDFAPEELAPIEGDEEDDGRRPLVVWEDNEDDDGVDNGLEGERGESEIVLWQCGKMRSRSYILVGDPIVVARAQLVVQRWSLLNYMLANGIEVPEDFVMPQPVFDPVKYIEKQIASGKSREEVAAKLYARHKDGRSPELIQERIAELLFPDGSQEHHAKRRRASRAIAKTLEGKKLLESNKRKKS